MKEIRCSPNCTCSQLKKAKESIAELRMIINNAAVKLTEVSECVKLLKCETCRGSSSYTEVSGTASPVEIDSIVAAVEEIDTFPCASSPVEIDSSVAAVEEINTLPCAVDQSSVVDEQSFASMDIREKRPLEVDSFKDVWTRRIQDEAEKEQEELNRKAVKKIIDINIEFKYDQEFVSRVTITLDATKIHTRPAVDDLVRLSKDNWNLIGKVEACRGFKTVYVTVLAKASILPPTSLEGVYRLDFLINNFTYKKMKESVERISESEESIVSSVLMGHGKSISKKPIKTDNYDHDWLNGSQVNALRTAIEYPVTLIFGPYGCGKTAVIGSIIKTVKSEGKVLAVAPSNLASDHLTESLAACGLEVLRVVSKAREQMTINSSIDKYCLHTRVRTQVGDVSGLAHAEVAKMENEARDEIIERADVIITTCSSASCNAVKSILKFSAIVVDEACQVYLERYLILFECVLILGTGGTYLHSCI